MMEIYATQPVMILSCYGNRFFVQTYYHLVMAQLKKCVTPFDDWMGYNTTVRLHYMNMVNSHFADQAGIRKRNWVYVPAILDRSRKIHKLN